LMELESRQVWSSAIIRLLDHLDNDLNRLKSMLVDMLQKRDQWLRHVLGGYEVIDLTHALDNLINEKLKQVSRHIPAESHDELCRLLNYAAANLADKKPESEICTCEGLTSIPGTSSDNLDQWRGIAELILTTSDTWRIQLNVNNGFPPANKEMKERMKALLDQYSRVEGLQQLIADIRILPDPTISDDEWDVVAALTQLLNLAARQLQIIFNEQGQQDFIGIAHSAVNALGSEDEPTDLVMYLDYQVKHILVDEFQDISVNQHVLLMRMTGGWMGNDGRTLFLVGDPMQSIYRFREAEVGNFIHTFHSRQLGTVPLDPLILSSNFRSNAGIVNWVNTTFQSVLAEEDDLTTGAVKFHSSTATIGESDIPSVSVYPQFDDDGSAEAAMIVDLIQTLNSSFWRKPESSKKSVCEADSSNGLDAGTGLLHSSTSIHQHNEGETSSDIAILVRTRQHLINIIPKLREANIPFKAIEIEKMGEKQVILDLLSLTRAWLYPADRIAWLSILRTPWCGLELKHLLLIGGAEDQLIINQINNPSVLKQCDTFSKQRIKHLAETFTAVNNERHRQSVRHSIETLWTRLGGAATLHLETELEDVSLFFELLDDLDRGYEIDDLRLLFNEVEQLFGKSGSDNQQGTVQVMTMHKAKGLEFKHVIIPGLGRTPRYGNTELMKWMLRPREYGGHDLLMGAIRQTGEEHTSIYKYIQSVEKQKETHESERLLYVATTRARQTLHLFGSVKRRQDKKSGDWECSAPQRSLLGHLWPVLKDQYEDLLEAPIQISEDAAQEINQSNWRLTKDWKLPDIQETELATKTIEVIDLENTLEDVEYEWASETIKRIGIVVHNFIQKIAEEGIEHWDEKRIITSNDRIKANLKQAGIEDSEINKSITTVTNALMNLLNDDRGRWILSDEHTEQDNELSLTGMCEGQLITAIIDRTFIDSEDTRWIVDYKSSPHKGADIDVFLDREQERYTEQFKKYGQLMQELDGRPVKLALYFPLLKGWREWTYSK
jgi:ATP-dependent helicase/nuclease subunit A